MNLPMLDLETREGARFPWQELWQRQNILVLIAHPSCETCRRVLADWAEQADALAAENTATLAVFESDAEEAPAGVRVIVDPGGRLRQHLDVPRGTALAADSFFEILARDDAHALGAEEAADDAIAWVKLAERKCDECGVGTW
jgi:hypothetical protein